MSRLHGGRDPRRVSRPSGRDGVTHMGAHVIGKAPPAASRSRYGGREKHGTEYDSQLTDSRRRGASPCAGPTNKGAPLGFKSRERRRRKKVATRAAQRTSRR